MFLSKMKSSSDDRLSAVIGIYEQSFPESERRPVEDICNRIDTDMRYTCYAVTDNDIVVGLLTTWDFGEFVYVEHLAVDPDCRGKNIGTAVIDELKSFSSKSIILEIEPVDDPGVSLSELNMRKARLRFYIRLGFNLCKMPYIQPPYALGQPSVPLMLMECNGALLPDSFEYVRKTLHTEVYGV